MVFFEVLEVTVIDRLPQYRKEKKPVTYFSFILKPNPYITLRLSANCFSSCSLKENLPLSPRPSSVGTPKSLVSLTQCLNVVLRILKSLAVPLIVLLLQSVQPLVIFPWCTHLYLLLYESLFRTPSRVC